MFYVEFASQKRPGTICSTGYDTLAEAVTVARIKYGSGVYPSIRCDEFRCGPMVQNKWAERPRLEWWMSFVPVGIYKGCACRRAEDAGVRYRSHRTGYRASDRAFRKFCASYQDLLDWRVANADVIAANARVAA